MTAKSWTRCVLLGLLLTLDASAAAAQQKSAESLLQEGVNQELVAGDLTKAIATYRQILDRHASNRRVGALALANLGRSYEKLGAAEARTAYQRLLREYADQTEPARFARGRLEALDSGRAVAGRPAPAPVLSMVYPELPPLRLRDNPHYDFSPDGEQIVMRVAVDPGDAKLGSSLVVASSGGAVVRTIVPARHEVGLAQPRWSPDGKYIAYREAAWIGADTSFAAVKIIPAEGGTPRTLTTTHTGMGAARGGFFWTPDSRAITVTHRGELVTLDLAGNVVRAVPFRIRQSTQITGYSPDGRWLAFQQDKGTEAEQMDVWLLPAEGGTPVQVTSSGMWDGWPAWAADGRSLYFVSNRSGGSNVWKVNVDPRSGAAQGEPVQLTSYTDVTVRHPRTLGDGKLAFALIREAGTVRVALADDPANNRAVARGRSPQLSPDGRTVYFVGQGVQPDGIFATATNGVAVTPRRLTTTAPDRLPFPSFSISPDGRALAYFTWNGKQNELRVVNTGTGAAREVARASHRQGLVPAWSPDGARLAYSDGKGLFVIPAAGGEPREIARMDAWDGWTVRWSPDGRHLAAFAWTESSSAGGTNAIVVVPAEGGEPRTLTPPEQKGYKEMLDWHPDGTRLTYMYYGDDDRADETRVAYMDGRPSTVLVDQPYPVWDYVGSWHPSGRDYYFIASTGGSWSVYAHDERASATRLVWDHQGAHPGAHAPTFSRDGKMMTWPTGTTARQLWVLEGIR